MLHTIEASRADGLKDIRAIHAESLFNQVIPFWESHSIDTEHGGYYSCLDRDGTVYDTDKFMWMQGREVWMFSHLYNRIRPDNRWLDYARTGAVFMQTYGMDPTGKCYFSIDCAGIPQVAPYNIYADCYAAMGFAEFARASGKSSYLDLARQLYTGIQKRKDDPKAQYNKLLPSARKFRAFGFSMIQINMAQVFRKFDDSVEYETIIEQAIDDIVKYHISEQDQIVWERVALDGSHPDCMEGRLLCPGHACEVIWFVAKIAMERSDGQLLGKLSQALLWTLERAWDKEFGGIYYYQDAKGFPTDKIEADMKLWWVHVEALYATLLLYAATGEEQHYAWFRKIHDWTFSHFPDETYGEWYGYLHRDGTLAKTLKGGKWKGFFHLPRALAESIGTIDELLKIQGVGIHEKK